MSHHLKWGAEGNEEFRQPWPISLGISSFALSNILQAL
jgi:hypothetical protein